MVRKIKEYHITKHLKLSLHVSHYYRVTDLEVLLMVLPGSSARPLTRVCCQWNL